MKKTQPQEHCRNYEVLQMKCYQEATLNSGTWIRHLGDIPDKTLTLFVHQALSKGPFQGRVKDFFQQS